MKQLLLFLLVAAISISFVVDKHNKKAEVAQKAPAVAKKSAAVVAKSNEIKLTADMKTGLGVAIRSAGYNCPAPKIAWAKGEDALGTVTKVFCGPEDRKGVYPNAVFRVTFTGADGVLVTAW